jgi:hypothetical protein
VRTGQDVTAIKLIDIRANVLLVAPEAETGSLVTLSAS